MIELSEARKKKLGEGRRGLLDKIAGRSRDAYIEEHITRHQPGDHRNPGEFPQEYFDQESRKGFLKLHILIVLTDGPTHGYEIMHRIHNHTGHTWMPSPGSLYPALELLGSKGFISCHGDGRRKVYSLTEKGKAAMGKLQKKQEDQFLEMKSFVVKLLDE